MSLESTNIDFGVCGFLETRRSLEQVLSFSNGAYISISGPVNFRKLMPIPAVGLESCALFDMTQGGQNGGNTHRRQGKRKVSETTCTSTEHIIARDCLTQGHTLHWEGDRNDQCEVCDKGGTLTECTRCNIVWHASCLQPTPVSPLRQQDAIVCGEECWTELTAAARSAGIPASERETHNTKSRFLAHKHHTTNTTHSFPLVTCAGHRRPCAEPTMSATEPEEQPTIRAQQPPGNRGGNTGNKRKSMNKAPHSERPKARRRTSPPTTKRKRAAGTPDKRAKKKSKPTLSAHINPWTISSGILRTQSLQATTAAAAAREMPP
jgi:hypothetical protein